jgi:hypothetical protein
MRLGTAWDPVNKTIAARLVCESTVKLIESGDAVENLVYCSVRHRDRSLRSRDPSREFCVGKCGESPFHFVELHITS